MGSRNSRNAIYTFTHYEISLSQSHHSHAFRETREQRNQVEKVLSKVQLTIFG